GLPRRERLRPLAARAGGGDRGRGVRAARRARRRLAGARRHAAGRRPTRAGDGMSITVGRYTFAAWLRRGIGTRINEVELLGAGDGSVPERATVPIDVDVNGHPLHKDFKLLGPGDAIGLLPDAVVRTGPPHGNGNFEPNYLPFVELYDEDLPWRYTPA